MILWKKRPHKQKRDFLISLPLVTIHALLLGGRLEKRTHEVLVCLCAQGEPVDDGSKHTSFTHDTGPILRTRAAYMSMHLHRFAF